MEWWVVLFILFGGFMMLLATGLPVAFSFGILNTMAILVFINVGVEGLRGIATGAFDSVATFEYVAVPLFILMGSVLMQTGLAFKAISSVDNWIGRIPGRLAVVAEAAGIVFGAASGSSMASTAVIGQVLIPEMLNRGYARWFAMGSVACTGGLDMLIPPSALVVIFAGIASMQVGPLLIACIIPGLIMGLCLSIFIVVISILKPEIAPPQQQLKAISFRERLSNLKDFMVIAVLILAVLGTMFFGIATPSESAALGAFASFILAALYRRLSFESIKKSVFSTVSVTGMTLFIITASKVFSQVLAYTGVTTGLVKVTAESQLSVVMVLFLMNVVVFIMGCFMDPVSIMMVIIPIFLPIARALGMDVLWWAVIMVVNIGLGLITPPFGMNLFVVKGVTPGNPDLMEVYLGIAPFVLIELVGLSIMILYPPFVTWLPSLMK